jgi:hypothetical protein
MALGKTNIAAILFTFSGDIAFLHRGVLYLFCPYKSSG